MSLQPQFNLTVMHLLNNWDGITRLSDCYWIFQLSHSCRGLLRLHLQNPEEGRAEGGLLIYSVYVQYIQLALILPACLNCRLNPQSPNYHGSVWERGTRIQMLRNENIVFDCFIRPVAPKDCTGRYLIGWMFLLISASFDLTDLIEIKIPCSKESQEKTSMRITKTIRSEYHQLQVQLKRCVSIMCSQALGYWHLAAVQADISLHSFHILIYV